MTRNEAEEPDMTTVQQDQEPTLTPVQKLGEAIAAPAIQIKPSY